MEYKAFIIFLIIANHLFAKDIFVSPIGNDKGNGTQENPYATFYKALAEVNKLAGKEAVTVWFKEGTYYLDRTIQIGSDYSGTSNKPVVFSALPGAKVVIKGSKRLENLHWNQYKDGIYVTQLPSALEFDQLFIDDERQIRARFPNYDYDNPLRGGKGYQQVTGGTDRRYDEWFSYNPKTFSNKIWNNPKTGIVHAYQSHNWGNMQYRIATVNREENKVYLDEGGWQLQRNFGVGGKGSKGSWYFIENIFEELDVPGEWFLDKESNLLYYYPATGVSLREAKVEVPVIKDFIQLKGSKESPVKNIQFKGFYFTQSSYTFMEEYEPVARGDWAIHRGGVIFMEGTEDCLVEGCSFEYIGGNGVFMSAYNRNNKVSGCRFVHTGESAVCFVGSPSAVRFYQTWDDKEIDGKDWNEMRKNMDLKPGPKTSDYPKECVVENSIMHDFGDVGKQVAGVYISMSHKIKASHNTIYNCPRAGICINDGTWGGHIIEFNDIWETARETGEHGPFNSWGRERQWKGSRGSDEHFLKELTKLDAIDNVIIRNNRIANYRKSISAGNWTIDLDDGSSYFEIYNNLNLGSTIKLRDGMARKVFNNITVSAVPLGWHVWPKESEDEIYKNIFVISGIIPGKKQPTKRFIRDVRLPVETKWSTNYDNNLYWNINHPNDFDVLENVNMEAWQKRGYDLNAVVGNPNFVDPINGNYQVKEDSPALKLGFKNFPMDKFGHQMTRIVPFGGEFSEEKTVSLVADNRASTGAKIYFTLDGSEPNTHSLEYSKPFQITSTTLLKAKTFNSNGIPVGFTTEAKFKKVTTVSYPSWLSTLLAGKYEGANEKKSVKALEKEVHGALMINIADDPDLIDATGGYDFGCYIKSIDAKKAKMWLNAGLKSDWVIQQINKHKIQNIADLEKYLKKYQGQKVTVIAVRDYNSKKFKVHIDK
ncbi:chitobiase/beta-hexosaminidase C-terminal domain-containing protein [Flavivirga aquimarina]|uniref:Chitobiase/beta-hexosaminidase C-terminal domain-containing protein n=1 Tax=Flavivirga aquimarina TaxID=2027862 RepID=A0ABT8WF61_9FLAO|nr:chitobiase/beta-hexosaminidase C-terminal domain-containing protein [Flavivirga aquimarina]MDO5971794.1 chitobiase/beta-hexosaminidase C-terminal domain-containing protein [Flavivirga aquimarina]